MRHFLSSWQVFFYFRFVWILSFSKPRIHLNIYIYIYNCNDYNCNVVAKTTLRFFVCLFVFLWYLDLACLLKYRDHRKTSWKIALLFVSWYLQPEPLLCSVVLSRQCHFHLSTFIQRRNLQVQQDVVSWGERHSSTGGLFKIFVFKGAKQLGQSERCLCQHGPTPRFPNIYEKEVENNLTLWCFLKPLTTERWWGGGEEEELLLCGKWR